VELSPVQKGEWLVDLGPLAMLWTKLQASSYSASMGFVR